MVDIGMVLSLELNEIALIFFWSFEYGDIDDADGGGQAIASIIATRSIKAFSPLLLLSWVGCTQGGTLPLNDDDKHYGDNDDDAAVAGHLVWLNQFVRILAQFPSSLKR